jgi:hypothetical protein
MCLCPPVVSEPRTRRRTLGTQDASLRVEKSNDVADLGEHDQRGELADTRKPTKTLTRGLVSAGQSLTSMSSQSISGSCRW